ncbi:MAG: hypothetical protein ABI607_06145 [Betaproteobacteria bacterium]
MRVISIYCAVAVAILLAGCAGHTIMGGGTRPPIPLSVVKCTYNDPCEISVTVAQTTPSSCTISPVDDVEVKGSAYLHTIRWVLDDASQDLKFRFPQNGIVLKNPDPHNQFSHQGPKNGGREFQWRDKNSNYADYPYTINVMQKGSAVACALDPKIFNN